MTHLMMVSSQFLGDVNNGSKSFILTKYERPYDQGDTLVVQDGQNETLLTMDYTCKCGTVTEGYVWLSQIKTTEFECTKCGKWLGHENLEKKATTIISIRTPTKNR
jgi:hypothetical protein